MFAEAISILYLRLPEGDFDVLNVFTAYAVNNELLNIRIVFSFATTKLVRFSGAIGRVVMELQTVKTPWTVV